MNKRDVMGAVQTAAVVSAAMDLSDIKKSLARQEQEARRAEGYAATQERCAELFADSPMNREIQARIAENKRNPHKGPVRIDRLVIKKQPISLVDLTYYCSVFSVIGWVCYKLIANF